MNCPQCNQPIEQAVNFCPRCGAALTRTKNRYDENVREALRSRTFKIVASVVGCLAFVIVCLASCPFIMALFGLGGILAWTNP